MTASSVSTVVVELTPPGRAAVAVVLIAGPNALEAIRHFFSPTKSWPADGPLIGRISLGRWGGPQGEELIVCRRDDDQFEIHCHGGVAAVRSILNQLVQHGCRVMTWQEWVRAPRGRVSEARGIESRRDSTTSAAQVALASAPTARTAAVLLDQYHGALSAAIRAARAAIAAADWPRAAYFIDGILKFRYLGLHLTTPWRVVLAGPPNVGKSSLINAIAGFQRAIVSPLPGTTRDVVTITTAINGWPVQLADTAGLREGRDELELAGVALAQVALAEADLVIVVSDASAGVDESQEVELQLRTAARVIRVRNKIDLVHRGGDAPARFNLHSVSALTGEGIPKLIAAIDRSLVPVAPPAGAAITFTSDQIASLEAVRAAIIGANAPAADAALAAMLATAMRPQDSPNIAL
ncbi:MAG: 50S ribosome-binding GTPase [Planctomycetes bacterium]|nr:50S ribosome-binding GTPase [Planctomycetota bacterium]